MVLYMRTQIGFAATAGPVCLWTFSCQVVALVRGLLSKAPSFPLTLASLRDALLGRKAKGNRYQQMLQAHPQFGCLQRARWTQAATARLLHSLVIHEVPCENISFKFSPQRVCCWPESHPQVVCQQLPDNRLYA